ncbi:mCG142120, isoform CRA_b [Mus musculus]|nr:mCG142120, isoform CRA_b [Mus musculus]
MDARQNEVYSIVGQVDRIIFCVFLEVDFKIYKKKMNEFFPVDDNNEGTDADMKEDSEGPEPKGLSPPHKKSKAKKPESSKDSSEGLDEDLSPLWKEKRILIKEKAVKITKEGCGRQSMRSEMAELARGEEPRVLFEQEAFQFNMPIVIAICQHHSLSRLELSHVSVPQSVDDKTIKWHPLKSPQDVYEAKCLSNRVTYKKVFGFGFGFSHAHENLSLQVVDESGPEEKQTAEEMEGQSQEADGVNTTPVPSPASEDKAEVHKDEDSAKDDNTVKDSDMTNHSVCDQELPNGQENDSAKSEGKTEAESPSSSMETEDLSPNQEDAAIVEQPEVIPLIDDQEAQEGGEAQGKDAPAVFAESQGSSEAENTSGPDVDMNSQVDGVNEPTESLQEDLQ